MAEKDHQVRRIASISLYRRLAFFFAGLEPQVEKESRALLNSILAADSYLSRLIVLWRNKSVVKAALVHWGRQSRFSLLLRALVKPGRIARSILRPVLTVVIWSVKTLLSPIVVMVLLFRKRKKDSFGGDLRILLEELRMYRFKKGMQIHALIYQAKDLIPFLQLSAQQSWGVNAVIVTNSSRLGSLFETSGHDVYVFPGEPVINKTEEIKIYQEIYSLVEELKSHMRNVCHGQYEVTEVLSGEWVTGMTRSLSFYSMVDHLAKNGVGEVIYLFDHSLGAFDHIALDLTSGEYQNSNLDAWQVSESEGVTDSCRLSLGDDLRSYDEPLTKKGGDYEKSIPDWLSVMHKRRTSRSPLQRLRYQYSQIRDSFWAIKEELQSSPPVSTPADQPVMIVTQAAPGTIYWKALLSTIRGLIDRGVPLVALTMQHLTYVELTSMGITTYVIGQNVRFPRSREHVEQAKKLSRRFMLQMSTFSPSKELEDELDVWSRDRIKHDLRLLGAVQMTHSQIRRAMIQLDLIDDLMDAVTPRSVLVMPHSSPLAKQAQVAARQRGIPTVSMPSVAIAGHRRSIPIDWNVDYIACYGEQCRDAFLDLGYAEEGLVLTGNAALDQLHELNRHADPDSVMEKLGFPVNKKLIVVATSRIDPKEYRWINEIIAYCRETDLARVVLKTHPSFSKDIYSGIDTSDGYCHVVEDFEIYELIVASTLVVTDYSTVGAEAVLVGKHLMVVNLFGKPYPSNNYDQYGIAELVDDLADTRQVVGYLLDSNHTNLKAQTDREAFLQQYNIMNDGRAGQRIADLLVNLPVGSGDS